MKTLKCDIQYVCKQRNGKPKYWCLTHKAKVSINGEKLKELEKAIQNHKHIRIWYSSLDNEDVSTLYFLIYYFYRWKNIEINLCDITDDEHFFLGSYKEEEIDKLQQRTRKITQEEQKSYYESWKRIENENEDLRIINNQNLTSSSFEYLDRKILSILKEYDKIRYWRLIGECMSKRLCGFYADIFF